MGSCQSGKGTAVRKGPRSGRQGGERTQVWEWAPRFPEKWGRPCVGNPGAHGGTFGLARPVPRDPTLFRQQGSVSSSGMRSVVTGFLSLQA